MVPSGVLFELFSKQGRRGQCRQEFGWGDKFVVVYVGVHGMSQKLETLLEAAHYTAEVLRGGGCLHCGVAKE